MRTSVVAVGDELLLGDIVNGNLAWVGRTLADAGIEVVRGFEVGDEVDAMVDVLRSALAAADSVVVCGGLGPTSDDRTRAALAALVGVGLTRDPQLLEGLDRWYRERGRFKPQTVDVQADRPDGASVIPNHLGTAPGLAMQVEGRWVFALPGVPAEMRPMLAESVVPELRRLAGVPSALVTVQLRVPVVGESMVAQRLEPVEAALPPGVRMAYLASPGEVRVRFTGTDPEKLDLARARARDLLGAAVSGEGEESLGASVLRALVERSATLAVAESLTGGQVLSSLVDVPGASAALRGGVVAYATGVKADLLGVPDELLDRVGGVDAGVAQAMAAGVRDRLGADWGVATTGVAGPEAQDGVPPGTVFVAVDPGVALPLRLRGDREIVRRLTTVNALELLRRCVLGLPTSQEQPW